MRRVSICGLWLVVLGVWPAMAAPLPAIDHDLVQAQSDAAGGFQARAIENLTQALATAQQVGDEAAIGVAAERLGAAYLAAGDRDRAGDLLGRSAEIAQRRGDHDLAARSANDTGNLALARGQVDTAGTDYATAATEAAAAGDAALQAVALLNEARAADRLNAADAAASLLAESRDVLAGEPPAEQSAMSWISLGRVAGDPVHYRTKSLSDLARAAFGQAAALGVARGDGRAASLGFGYLGASFERGGEIAPALAATDKAMFWAQANAPDLLYRWDWQEGRLQRRSGDTERALQAYRRAVEAVERIRQDIPVTYENGRSSYFATIGPLYLEMADLLLRRASATGTADAKTALLIEARATLEALKLSELRDYFQDPCVDAGRTARKSVDSIAARTAVLYPVILPDRLELLVYAADGVRQVTVSVGAAELGRTARQFRQLLEKRATREYLAPSHMLYDWLIRPLLPLLGQDHVDTIVWIPDGALRTIPLAALADGTSFVIDRFAISTAPGLDLIDPRPLAAVERPEALFAGLSVSRQGFAGLPAVRTELETASRIEPGKLLIDDGFKKAAFEDSLRNASYSIVHVASHGVFDHDPAKSFLLAYDERMSMGELESAVQATGGGTTPLELLVLSACETAAGDDRAALGLAGVALKAGARSAVASLWSVNDEAAARIVETFYQGIKQGGMSKAEALRRSQTALKSDPRFRHPAYWAPFLLIGNWL